MNITFAICVSPNANIDYLENLIYSIMDMLWDEDEAYEIICCGDFATSYHFKSPTFTVIPFDESVRPGWITRKKNLMVQAAKYENIVIVHDYYLFDELFCRGMARFDFDNPEWKIMTNTIWTFEGERSADWLVNQRYMDRALEAFPHFAGELMAIAPNENGPRWVCGLPYNVSDLTHIQYISGAYIIAKKDVLLECPLNETIGWGDSEDIIWSQDVIQHGYKFHFNPLIAAFIQKPGKWHLYEMPEECVLSLRELFGSNEILDSTRLKVKGADGL